MQKRGFKLVTGGTSNHLILADIHSSFGIGKEAEIAMDKIGLTLNIMRFQTTTLCKVQAKRYSLEARQLSRREAPRRHGKNHGMDEAVNR